MLFQYIINVYTVCVVSASMTNVLQKYHGYIMQSNSISYTTSASKTLLTNSTIGCFMTCIEYTGCQRISYNKAAKECLHYNDWDIGNLVFVSQIGTKNFILKPGK